MIRTLNSLRFILILMIVMSHATLPISQACNDYLGEYAVVIFFIISGFVLSLSYGERLVKEEMSNKKILSFTHLQTLSAPPVGYSYHNTLGQPIGASRSLVSDRSSHVLTTVLDTYP